MKFKAEKAMGKFVFFITTVLLISTATFGQDTIRVEASIHYSSEQEPNRGKTFASRARYSREDIVFSDTHKRIEYCYYYNNERHCYGKDYKITNDTTIDVDGKIWNYSKRGNAYFIERYFNGTYECGLSKSLIPFQPLEPFVTTTSDKIDTLWITYYNTESPSSPYNSYSRKFHKTKVKGRIYSQDKIDEAPTLLNGDSLQTIYLRRNDYCISSPIYFLDEIMFIVTKEGRVVNIEQSKGNFNLQSCPAYIMDVMRYVVGLGKMSPAKKNSKNVNVLWKLKVVMNDETEQP